VFRRCPAPLTALFAALAFGLGSRPTVTQAASSSSNPPSSSTYSWITSVGFPALGSNPTGPQIQFLVEPYGALEAYSSSTGPLAGPILVTPALGSSNQVYVGLKDGTSSSGQPEQFLGLFFSQGLQAGSSLQVPLYYNTSQAPQLIPQTSGVSPLNSGGNSSGGGGSQQSSGGGGSNGGDNPITNAQAPEPLSLMIWTALALCALVRAYFLSRSRRVVMG
jgi:hypothetical protein